MSGSIDEAATLVGSSKTSETGTPQLNIHEAILHSHPKYLKYKTLSEGQEWSYDGLEKENLVPNLTGRVLMGTDKINFRDRTFYLIHKKYSGFQDISGEYGDNFSVTFLHLGDMLSGHNGIIHGGLLATLLDELTCRLAFQNFPSKKGVTANLNINYRRPCYVDNYIMVKCSVLEKQGRKCKVRGSVYLVDLGSENDVEDASSLLTECEVLVIEPKWVQDLHKSEPKK